MAIDEAIAEAVAAAESPPTLRLYGWEGTWLSIGMAQPIADLDLVAGDAASVGVVRRPSGGTAVHHVDQVGWSVTLPLGHPLAPGDIVGSYLAQSRITLDALARLGVAARAATVDEARAPLPDPVLSVACFGGLAPHEIVVGDPPRKVVGWGQVRRRNVVLHHAVLSLTFDPRRLSGLLAVDHSRLERALARRVLGLDQAAGRAVVPEDVAAAVVAAYEANGFPAMAGELSPSEEARAATLIADKYAAPAWTSRR